jgi:hypothetical protein
MREAAFGDEEFRQLEEAKKHLDTGLRRVRGLPACGACSVS